jgi:hypothetical protein
VKENGVVRGPSIFLLLLQHLLEFPERSALEYILVESFQNMGGGVTFFTWHILEVSPSHLACERPEERSSDRKWPDSPVQVKTWEKIVITI